ncbi:major histocompatibility complex class I-related gene protein-like isoform X1 [Oreochromis aureus]|uniref:Ig-like domain-containing protein n=1 Tax=Oreochromis aureus TaxID=47969 RepID=A0A668RHN8_OREAU|nr:major histocompatibility complex class I-related gene protein-like isoform X1 [Oreochromis aureus]
MMRLYIFLFLLDLLEVNRTVGVTHSLKYFYTASSGIQTFPEFVAVGLVDEIEMIHFDSLTAKAELKHDWVHTVTKAHPEYLEYNTENFVVTQEVYKTNMEVAKERFNQSGGTHILQMMTGCEWDDETEERDGFKQFGYDGEDFITFDLNTATWVSPKPQAVRTKMKWNSDWLDNEYRKSYLAQECVKWLNNYLRHGRNLLPRTVRPSVSLLQKSSSSSVTCHATGFYPNRAEMFWRKNGKEIHDDVDKGEILTNHDGTFQMSVYLDLSSIKPDHWQRYDCVFQLSGVNEDIVTKVDKAVIKTNKSNPFSMTIPVIVAVVVLVAIAVIGFIIYKKKTDKRPPCSVENREVQEQMIPQA